MQLLGKTLGVIGLGGIGREVARIGKGMGMEVIGWNRTKHAEIAVPLVDIDTLLARADVVSMNLTLGDETRGFLSAERIARMKPGAIYVNTARGALVDEAALIAALKSGHIRHAGLDVFHAEPLKRRSPAGQARERHAVRARRLPHAGGVDDAAAPRHRYREENYGIDSVRSRARGPQGHGGEGWRCGATAFYNDKNFPGGAVKPAPFAYAKARSLEEAMALLGAQQGRAAAGRRAEPDRHAQHAAVAARRC